MVRLDMGSGGKRGGEWLGVDPYVDDAEVQAFMWDVPFEANSVDEIFSSHALEHVGRFDVPRVLTEWYRILKPSGTVTLRVPDLEWCVLHWLRHKDSVGWNIDIIFGNQNHDGEFHKTGFTEATLQKYVTDAGFKITKFERLDTHSQMTLSIEATKE
jgi:predicted SAM-dependent methyltransferase